MLIALIVSVLFTAWREATAHRERAELTRQLIAKDQDMLDRLMAKDLQDVKYKQQEPVTAGITSKRRNNERLVEERAKIAGVL